MFVTGVGILHADLDAFFASVEQRDNPRLRGRPVIVGAGVVLAASYEARACGVRSAMGGAQARRRCPEAVVVDPNFSAYVAASRAVFEVYRRTTPLVRELSIDEAFLDVRGLGRLAGPAPAIAARLRQEVRAEVGLTITVGVARTPWLAKVASGVAKPDGLLTVPVDGEADFLRPLRVEQLWGVGPVTAGRLQALHLRTVGDVAGYSEAELVSILGRGSGRLLHHLVTRREQRPVRGGADPARRAARSGRNVTHRRSIGSQCALGRSPTSPARAETVLSGLVDRVTRRMRRAGRAGRTVILRLRFDDFTRATRSRTLPLATDSTAAILAAARGLLAAAAEEIASRGLTLIGISVTNLDGDGWCQPELPFETVAGLDAALDRVRDRFGSNALSRATLLGRDPSTLDEAAVEAGPFPTEPSR
ncbi:MAG: DNA polymerase IV [bacterium]